MCVRLLKINHFLGSAQIFIDILDLENYEVGSWKFQLGNSKLQHSLERTIVSAKCGSCLVSGLPQISLEANYYYLIVLSVWIRASQKNVCAR